MKMEVFESTIGMMGWEIHTLDNRIVEIPLTINGIELNDIIDEHELHDGTVEEYRETICPAFNNELYKALNEIHYTVATQRICETKYDIPVPGSGKDCLTEQLCIHNLSMLDELHNQFLLAKKIFFCEISESLERFSNYKQEEKLYIPDDLIASFSEEFLMVMDNFSMTNYTANSFYLREHFDNLEKKLYNLLEKSNESQIFHTDLRDAIKSIIECIQNDIDKKHYGPVSRKTAELIDKFITLLRKKHVFGLYGEIIWLICFLYKYRTVLHYVANDKLEFPSIQECIHLEPLLDVIRKYVSIFDYWSNRCICDIEFNMLVCYQTHVSKHDFETRINEIIKALKSNKEIWKKYSLKSGASCFAAMNHKGINYASLSGINIDYFEDDVKKILSGKYVLIGINENVRYYYFQNSYTKYIQYSYYKKNPTEINRLIENQHINKLNAKRMFSCCEKKLLTVLYGKKGEFIIYVKYKPCPMCEKAFEDYDYQGKKSKIRWALSGKTTINQKDKFNYDKMASIIESFYLKSKTESR